MRPQPGDYPVFYDTYISLTKGDNVLSLLGQSIKSLEAFLYTLREEKADFAYAEGKWTVKNVLQHCIDTERIFAYRALAHARGEQQSLPGFEQNDYADAASVKHRTLLSLVEEFLWVRRTTLLLFESFTPEDMSRTGTVNKNPVKTFCWGFIIEGHWLHHQQILKARYYL